MWRFQIQNRVIHHYSLHLLSSFFYVVNFYIYEILLTNEREAIVYAFNS